MFLDCITKIDIVNCDDTGSDVSRRFDYQLACAFLTLLTVCKRTEDFAVILERVDDFLIVENVGKKDECISFVQVKTDKNTQFTLNCIVKNEWIKKQAEKYLVFLDTNIRNIFLTNLGIKCSGKLVTDTSLIRITDLPESEDKTKLINQITGVLGGKGSVDDFFVIRGTLSLDGFDAQLKGHLIDYINSHNGNISSELIETIYREIWHDLHNKQKYVLNEAEKRDYQEIISKKGIEYASIKNIVSIAKSIEIPEKGDMYSFFEVNPYNYDGFDTILSFLNEYNAFRSQSHTAMHLLEECRIIENDNLQNLNRCKNAYEYSCSILNIFDNNTIVSESYFYQKYRVCIAAMFSYKAYKG